MATAVTQITPLPSPVAGYNSIGLGQLGSDYIDDTTDYTGDWVAVTILADTTFTKLISSLTYINGATSPGNIAKLVSKGITLYGRFSEIQLSAGGIVIAYRAK